MWTTLLGGLQTVAAAGAEDAANVVPGAIPDAAPGAEPGIPGFDGKLPTPQQLLEALESMTGLSDEERTQLKEDLMKNIQDRANQAQAALGGGDFTTQTIVLLALLSIVALIFERTGSSELTDLNSKSEILTGQYSVLTDSRIIEIMESILKSLQSSSRITKDLQEKLSTILNGNVTENLSDLVNRYREMSVEDKQKVEGDVVQAFQQSFKQIIGNVRHNMQPWYLRSEFVFTFALLIVALLLVFFVYKLFKLLSDREIKREEKKKNKQLKKKK